MPFVAIVIGGALMTVGILGYVMPEKTSLTALIPAALGLLIETSGALSLALPKMRKHFMHFAAMVGLLGFLSTVLAVMQLGALINGDADRPAAVLSKTTTAGLCLLFVVLCIKSFIDARRAREAEKMTLDG